MAVPGHESRFLTPNPVLGHQDSHVLVSVRNCYVCYRGSQGQGPWHTSHQLRTFSPDSLFPQQLLSWRNPTGHRPTPLTVNPSRLQKWGLKPPDGLRVEGAVLLGPGEGALGGGPSCLWRMELPLCTEGSRLLAPGPAAVQPSGPTGHQVTGEDGAQYLGGTGQQDNMAEGDDSQNVAFASLPRSHLG